MPTDLAFLTRAPFAHRGLHGGGIVENTRAAWEAAVAAGHGIECDVQRSADGVAIVFHDYRLARLTGEEGRVAQRNADELGAKRYLGCEETIAPLAAMTAALAGRAPLLIEIKIRSPRVGKLCRSVARALEDYPGEPAVMSFNPEVGRWFAAHAPGIARGLVVTETSGSLAARLDSPVKRSLAMARARPQFLAYDIRDLPSPFAASLRAQGMPVLTWTVATPEQHATARAHADQIIYETAR